MTKILITYASYGNGHKSAALSVYNYLKDKGYEVKIIDILKYGNIFSKIDKKTFELNYKYQQHHFLFTLAFRLTNNKIITSIYKKLTNFLFKSELKEEILNFNPDICISTHFFGNIAMAIVKKKFNLKTKIIDILTDYKAHTIWLRNYKMEDAIIVPNNKVKKDLIKYGIPQTKIYPFGIPIDKKFNKLSSIKKTKEQYQITNLNKTVLFLGGGGYGSSFSYNYLKELLDENLEINIIFVAGNNIELKEKCEDLIKENNIKNVKILGFTDDMPNLLNIADLVITKPGGIVTTEAMAMHTPLILIPGNGGPENYNAKFIIDNKFGLNSKSPNELIYNVKLVLNDEKLLISFKNNLTKQIENNALEKLVNLIKEMEEIK